MATTRRALIRRSTIAAGTALIASAQTDQEPAALRGKVQDGKLDLPPLHNSTESSGTLPNPEPSSKRMGVAIVGIGHLTMEQILPGFGEAKYVRPVALVSGDAAKARTVAAQYGVPEKNLYSYTNFDEIKNNPEIEIVYIVLPNSMHAEYTVRAAAAGKHVLCEKPMATSQAECQHMLDACRKTDRELMIAYRMQYNRLHRELRQMTRSQRFGGVRFISAVNGQNDAPNGQWRQIKSMSGGGSLPDVGIYCLNAFRYLTGEEPYQVTGQITKPDNDPRFREIEDVCTFTLKFPSGILASGSCGYSFHETRLLRVMASDAWFGADPAFSYDNLTLQIGHKAGKANALEEQRYSPQNQFAVEMDDFAQRLQRRKKPLTGGEEGLRDQIIIDAIYRSAANNGAVVELPRVTKLDSTRGEMIDFES